MKQNWIITLIVIMLGMTACNDKEEINPTVVKSITLNKTSLTLHEGDEETLTTIILPEDASNKKVTWESSEEAVATVTEGKVIAKKAGTTTITAKAGDKSAKCIVTVVADIVVEKITLDKTSLSIYVEEEITLVASISPEEASGKKVAWTIDKPEIASVSDEGKVKGLQIGKAIVTATAGNKTATCEVSVLEKEPDATLSVDPNTPIAFKAYPSEEDVFKVSVTTNQSPWDVVADKEWCKISKCPDGEPNFFVSATPNTTSLEPLSAKITVTAGKAKPIEIEVTQEGISLLETAEVGDYFYSDGSFSKELDETKTCIGLVYSKKTATYDGRIVAPDELGRTTWALTTTGTGTSYDASGYANMDIIKEMKDWKTKYPSFAWCAEKGEEWYIPARLELNILVRIASEEEFTAKLEAIPGAVPIKWDGYYWSSTEDGAKPFWAWINAKGYNISTTKGAYGAFRAIRRF